MVWLYGDSHFDKDIVVIIVFSILFRIWIIQLTLTSWHYWNILIVESTRFAKKQFLALGDLDDNRRVVWVMILHARKRQRTSQS